MMNIRSKYIPPINIETFNKNKISEDFKKSCEKAGKLFKQDKKEESQDGVTQPAQPHETKC